MPDSSAETDPSDPRQLVFAKNLREFRGRLSAAEQVGEVEVRAWDADAQGADHRERPGGTVSAALELSDPTTMAGFFGDPAFVAVRRPLSTRDLADAVAKAIAERIGSGLCRGRGRGRRASGPARRERRAVSAASARTSAATTS